jgi:hypothetical protein
MRSKLFAILVLVLAVSFVSPSAGHAGRYGHGRHYGWYGPGAFAGGLIVGSALARPRYYWPPPLYVYSPPPAFYPAPAGAPAYAYPSPSDQGYAYADPGYAAGAGSDQPPGQWVTVPGQWAGTTWIPSHRAWVPVQ